MCRAFVNSNISGIKQRSRIWPKGQNSKHKLSVPHWVERTPCTVIYIYTYKYLSGAQASQRYLYVLEDQPQLATLERAHGYASQYAQDTAGEGRLLVLLLPDKFRHARKETFRCVRVSAGELLRISSYTLRRLKALRSGVHLFTQKNNYSTL